MPKCSKAVWRFLVLTSLLTLSMCQLDDDTSDVPSNQIPQGLGRILFKHMRFRDIPADEESLETLAYLPWKDVRTPALKETGFLREIRDQQHSLLSKRERQELLVNNLAALLTDINKGKTSASSMRMPSLRFG